MYSVIFHDHVQITHSLPGAHFGLAQNIHGSTYMVTVEIFASRLDEWNQIIDMSVAKQIINKVLSLYNYKNLDNLTDFSGKLTTPEFLSAFIADKIERQLSLIDIPNKTINQIKVTIDDPTTLSASFWKRMDKQ